MIISVAKAAEAAGVLDVELEGLTAETVTKAYRDKAKECHPDHHGNERIQQWSRVSWAKECLTHWAEQHKPNEEQPEAEYKGDGCRACRGTGRVTVAKRSFSAALTMACVICRGLGTLIIEEDDHD